MHFRVNCYYIAGNVGVMIKEVSTVSRAQVMVKRQTSFWYLLKKSLKFYLS